MNYIYMLRCKDGTYYTGWTNHLLRRYHAHKNGKGAKYTRARGVEQLVHVEILADKSKALQREYAIKQLTRQEKEALIGGGKGTLGKIFYLMGKSASGKDTLYEKLLQKEELSLKALVIYTTRPRRAGEEDGVTYHFSDEAQLQQLRAQGKVIEERSYSVVDGLWHYFTVDDGSFDGEASILGIGTPESFTALRAYFGEERVVPLYISVSDKVRIHRALQREDKQETPHYEEMCRRFLADQEDFAPDALTRAGIAQQFANDGELKDCLEEITDYVLACQRG